MFPTLPKELSQGFKHKQQLSSLHAENSFDSAYEVYPAATPLLRIRSISISDVDPVIMRGQNVSDRSKGFLTPTPSAYSFFFMTPASSAESTKQNE